MIQNKLKVLVIDHSPLVAPRIKNLLDDMADYLVIGEARSNKEATALLKQVVPDVVLLDLPCKELIDTLIEIKTEYPSVKIIVFTNYTSSDFMNTCIEMGADHFLEKSVEFNMVPIVLHEMIAKDLDKIE